CDWSSDVYTTDLMSRAQSSTPPWAATTKLTKAQMPNRKNFMFCEAPQPMEPERRHPPRPSPEFCRRLPGWENESHKPAFPEHSFRRTRESRRASKAGCREDRVSQPWKCPVSQSSAVGGGRPAAC